LLALGAASGAGASAEQGGAAPLHVVTAHLPPLVMAPGEKQPRALRELVDALCKRLDLAPGGEFMPWRPRRRTRRSSP